MKKIIINNLQVDEGLVNFINKEAIPGTNVNIDNFWNNFRIHFSKRVNNTEDYCFSNISPNWYFFSKKV